MYELTEHYNVYPVFLALRRLKTLPGFVVIAKPTDALIFYLSQSSFIWGKCEDCVLILSNLNIENLHIRIDRATIASLDRFEQCTCYENEIIGLFDR